MTNSVHPRLTASSRRAIAPLRGHNNILLVEPVDYPELVFPLRRCHFVLTDCGGIQEEALSFGKPVLVTRDTTRRPEGDGAWLSQARGERRGLAVQANVRTTRRSHRILPDKPCRQSHGDR